MRGKMKWLVFSLLVLGGLALSLTLFSGGQGASAAPAAQKMPKGLQMLCALYNDLERAEARSGQPRAAGPGQKDRFPRAAGPDHDAAEVPGQRR